MEGVTRCSPRWSINLGFALENNRDIEDFRFLTTDLFRYNMLLGFDFQILPKLFFDLGYSRALSPLVGAYLMTNPTDQFLVGIKYQIL